MAVNYLEVIARMYPDVQCYAQDPYNYATIVWVSSVTTTIPIAQSQLDADNLTIVKEDQIAEIRHEVRREIMGGFASTALGSTYYYDSGIEDQLNLIGAAEEASQTGLPISYGCRATPDGPKVYIEHTPAQISQVLTDGKNHKLNILLKYNNKRNLINNATTVTDIEAITWTSVP